MAIDGAGVGARNDDLNWSLLDAKLTAPRVRSGTVSRRSVIESARSSGRRIVGITAPAGYGKTTLLAEWAAAEDRPVAWVSLDRFDDDAAALLLVMAAAFVSLWPADNGLLADLSVRAGLYGGRLEAGRRADGDYAVQAWLPLEPSPCSGS